MILFQKLSPILSLLFVACSPFTASFSPESDDQIPFDQLDLAENACGPAALLNSARFGSKKWTLIATQPPGITDRERLLNITRGSAMSESSSIKGRARWTKRGINLVDLKDVANELAQVYYLPSISIQTYFLKPYESQSQHLSRLHQELIKSFRAGLPPILSLRRYAYRSGQWQSIHSHFVTITSIPSKLSANDSFFSVSYIDPWGGKIQVGEISISMDAVLSHLPDSNPNLEAKFPMMEVGKNLLQPGEKSHILVSGGLGAF